MNPARFRLSGILFLVAGIAFIASGIAGKRVVFSVLGCSFITIGGALIAISRKKGAA
jgi:uncharacterized membrane protein HdeD (DUF308 family)